MVCPKQYVVHFLILATYCVPLEWPKRLIQHNVHGDRPKHFQYNVYSICRRQWMVEQKVDNAIQRIVVSSIFLTQLTRTSHETLPFINISLFLLIIIFKSWIVNIFQIILERLKMKWIPWWHIHSLIKRLYWRKCLILRLRSKKEKSFSTPVHYVEIIQ